MPNNTPIPEAELEELRRRHEAATPGEMSVDRYHTLLDADGKYVLFTGIQIPMTPGPRQDQARANMAEYSALHNAFPGIFARLEAVQAERDHWRELLVSLDKDALCDAHLGIGAEEYLAAWLAARDAQQRREGAAEAYEEMRKQAVEVGKQSGLAAKFCKIFADECIEQSAQRIREGK